MKIIKIVFGSLAVLVLVLLLAVIILLNHAGLQTSLANRFAPDGVSIEKAHVGFKGLTVEKVRVEEDGMTIRVERVRGDFSLLRTLTSRHLHLNELTVANVHVDLGAWEAPPEPEPTPPHVPTERPPRPERPPKPDKPRVPVEKEPIFKGLFREALRWPSLSIDQLAVNADIILPGGQQTATLTLAGKDIRADVQPEIRLALTYADSSDEAAVTQATLENTLILFLSEDGILKGIQMTAHADADIAVEEIQEKVTLTLQLEVQQQADAVGEDYRVALTLYPETARAAELLTLHASHVYAENKLTGKWTLAADTRSVASVVDPILVGAFASLQSEGTFSFDLISEEAALQGTCAVRAEQLDQFQPELATVPTVLLDAAFDVAGGAERLDIGALRVDLSAPFDTLLVTLRAEQTFGYDLINGQPIFSQPDEPLARLTIAGVPVDLINAYLPDMRIALSSFTGDLVLAGAGDTLQLSTVSSLTIKNLHVEQQDTLLLEDITLALSPSATYEADILTFDLGSLTLSQQDRLLAELDAQGTVKNLDTDPLIELDANADIQLPHLLAQPVAEPFRNLTKGTMRTRVNASGTADSIKAQLELQLSDLVLAQDERRMDNMAMHAQLRLNDFTHIQLTAPLTVTIGPETTAVQMDIELWTGEEIVRAEVKGQGKQVFVEHFLLLADAFQNPDYTPPVVEVEDDVVIAPDDKEAPDIVAAEEAPHRPDPKPERAPEPEPEPQPLWAGIQADLRFDSADLVLPGPMWVHEVALHARVDETSARLELFNAKLGDSPASAQGGLHFRPDEKDHYHLEATVLLKDFDVGAFLREADPDTEPMMDAIVSLTGDVQSAAPSPEQLADYLTGHFSLVADHAVVRAFQRGRVGRALDVATTAGRIGGLVTGQQDVEAVSQLVTYFNRVVFDEMVVEAQRNPDLSIDLTRLLFRNPDLLIQGHGTISHVEGREFHQQPIALHLEMGARPPLASLFDDLKLLQEEPNELGYRPLNEPIKIEGNVGEPDPRPLWKIILDASTQRALPRLLKEDRDEDKRDRRRAPLDRLQQYL